ncbi:MAG: hypothetical protein IT238_09740 [Bacteroidia bacterium]|nr:hypothetical protein [Bacteroidia bacterium]MCZ2249586.1 hypothetical protein [Bacteroidia bacterium]
MQNISHYNLLANLFRYPDHKYKTNIIECANMLQNIYPDAFEEMKPFYNYILSKDDDEIEEIFAKTFHIQAVCFLDIGYVLFAEDYKRGDFLVKVKSEQEKVNNDCGNELADNLPNILTLLPLLHDKLFLAEFAVRIVKPAIEKMLDEFNTARMELKDKVRQKKQKVIIMENVENKNIFQYALQALYTVIQHDFAHVSYNDPLIKPTIGSDFLKNCNTGCSTTPQLIKNN